MNEINWLLNTPIAHRGLHDDIIPENTVKSVSLAAEKGFNIEIDVRLSKDKKIVVFHDDSLLRLCGAPVDVSSLSFSELSEYNLKQSGEKIPTFKEILLALDGKSGLLIELKAQNSGELEPLVLEELQNYKGNFAVQAFNPFCVKWFKDNAPDIPRGLLATRDYPKTLAFYKRIALKSLMFLPVCMPDFISYDERYIKGLLIKHLTIPKLVWTIRNRARAEEILSEQLANNVIFENYIP